MQKKGVQKFKLIPIVPQSQIKQETIAKQLNDNLIVRDTSHTPGVLL